MESAGEDEDLPQLTDINWSHNRRSMRRKSGTTGQDVVSLGYDSEGCRPRPPTVIIASAAAHAMPNAISFGIPCGDSFCAQVWILLTALGNGFTPKKNVDGLSASRRAAPTIAASVAARACRSTAQVAPAIVIKPRTPSRLACLRKSSLPSTVLFSQPQWGTMSNTRWDPTPTTKAVTGRRSKYRPIATPEST